MRLNPSIVAGQRCYWSVLLICLSWGLLGCAPALNPPPPVTTPPPATRPIAGLPTTGQALPITAQAIIQDTRILLEVADTPEAQATGLMFRPSLAADRGMLFTFNPPRPVQFWMKNVVISLDMVFLREGRVLAIAADVPPCTTNPCPTYGPSDVIDQVIELRGGRAAELGLAVGDTVTIEAIATPGR